MTDEIRKAKEWVALLQRVEPDPEETQTKWANWCVDLSRAEARLCELQAAKDQPGDEETEAAAAK